MKMTPDKVELNEKESIPWEKVRLLRLINNSLFFVLKNHKKIELKDLSLQDIDQVFKLYGDFLKTHPKNFPSASKHSSKEET